MGRDNQALPRLKNPDEPGQEPDGFVCAVCGLVLPREGALLRHERTHQPERRGVMVANRRAPSQAPNARTQTCRTNTDKPASAIPTNLSANC